MFRPLVLVVLLASPTAAADRPVAPPPKPAAVKLAGVRLAGQIDDPHDLDRLVFTPDGRRLTAVSGGPGDYRLAGWDLWRPDRGPDPSAVEENDLGESNYRTIGSDGRVGAAVRYFDSPDGRVRRPEMVLVDPGTGKLLRRLDPPMVLTDLDVLSPRFSGDGRRMVWYGVVWDVPTGRRVATVGVGRLFYVNVLAISHDGSALLVNLTPKGLEGEFVQIGVWDVVAGRLRWSRLARVEEQYSERATFTFSADGSRIVARPEILVDTVDTPIRHHLGLRTEWALFRVLDAKTGRWTRDVIGPPLEPLRAVGDFGDLGGGGFLVSRAWAVSPDGRTGALADYDDTVYLWDLDADRSVFRFRADPRLGMLTQMAFGPDGRTLAVSGQDGSVWLYPLPVR